MDIKDLPESISHKGKEYGLSIEYGRYSKEWYLCYKFYQEYDEPTAIHKCYDPDLINCMHKLKDLISVPGVNQKDSAAKHYANMLDIKDKVMKLIITDKGAPDAGIPEATYEVECPIVLNPMQVEVQFFKEQMVAFYSNFAFGEVSAVYNFER